MDYQQQSGGYAGIGALSSLMSGFSQYQSGKAQQGAYQYNAAIDLQQMKEAETASEAKYSALMGKQRSLYGISGVSISSGSPLLIAVNTAAQMDEEEQRIHQAGTEKAGLEEYYGKVAAYTGTVGGISTFFAGLQKAGQLYQQGQGTKPSPFS